MGKQLDAIPDVSAIGRVVSGELGWVAELRARVETLERQLASHAEQSVAKQQELIERIDADGDGGVDHSEFTAWAGEQAVQMADLEARLKASVARALHFSKVLRCATTHQQECLRWRHKLSQG